ncbi:sensor histidine kinase [Leptospira noguchii]|uniref:histidine kinase n=2 Tax=Leptospira noguchii TaxID=28182 RepID=A0AAE9GCR6_9LEPT|nr:sensor histidine kinase [Leptospira noguchii]UOG32241.1 sensor histidine kinase [Leptospira noguchii]UOG35268.1 sensor histidine kinase [Leptospira noguchii]UOG46183.1 sensor histidine kinase [Leptospira noguchii]UOG54404.1 sensor histidine kinase [Leptospira noguchii]UOG55533.1 sensor histidine kinase [Leptospira noguchii]
MFLLKNMILKRLQRIYSQEPFILRIRALYLFVFNVVTFVLPGITFCFFFNEVTYRPSFIMLISFSFLSMLLVWYGQYKKALTLTLFTVVVGITLGLFFGDPEGNALYSFPILVIIFLLFTTIRITIYISIYSFLLIFYFLNILSQRGMLKTSFAVDSVLGFFFFTSIALLTVNLLNSYIKEKDELIKEIHHRVRNNLQVLSGLADLHRNDKSDSQKVLFEFQNRILAMSEVHNYMYKSDNYHSIEFSNVIEKIIENLKSKHKNLNVTILNYVEKVDLPIETAIPCAMIFNELLNNSFTHAFKESKNPNIEIYFSKNGENYKLTLKDNGVGMSAPIDLQKSKTTGFTLVHILSKQIRAKFKIFNDQGLVAVLEF